MPDNENEKKMKKTFPSATKFITSNFKLQTSRDSSLMSAMAYGVGGATRPPRSGALDYLRCISLAVNIPRRAQAKEDKAGSREKNQNKRAKGKEQKLEDQKGQGSKVQGPCGP